MNKGMMALKKERPDVAKKMGYMYGGKVKKMMGGGMTMKKMMGGGMTMKDKKKMMGSGMAMEKMMGGGMAMKYNKGGMAMKNKKFNSKCDGKARRGKTRARMV